MVIDTDSRRGRDRMVVGYFGDRCKCQKLVSISYCHVLKMAFYSSTVSIMKRKIKRHVH